MAHNGWARRTWSWLEPWLEQLAWLDPCAAGAYLDWQQTQAAVRSRHLEVLKIA